MFKRLKPWLIISGVIILLDQITKIIIEQWLYYGQQWSVIDYYFNLTLLYNPGAAFSFLADAGGWQRWFFIVLTVGICAYLFHWLNQIRPDQKRLGVALALVLGGAIGNLIDRILYGHVVDFIQIHYHASWYYPAFNIADSAITIGVVLLIIDMWREPATPEKKEQPHG